MSDENPFAVAPPLREGDPEPIPTGVFVVSLVAAILGSLGLLGSCFAVVSLLASEQFMAFMPPEAQEAAKEAIAFQFIPGVIQTVLGLLLSTSLIVAAIGCFTRKRWGQSLMRLTMVGCVFSSLLAIGFQVWMIMFHAKTMAKLNEAQGMSADQALQMFYVGQIFAFLCFAVLMGFYLFSVVYLGKQHVTDFFQRQPR